MNVTYAVRLIDATTDVIYTISADVLRLKWSLGFARAYDSLGTAQGGQITLRNQSGDYTPEISALPLTRGTGITIDADGTRLYTGFITQVETATGSLSRAEAVIHFADALAELERLSVRLPVQVDVSADAVCANVLDTPPLDRLTRGLDAGMSRLSYVGDTWGDGITARQAITEVVSAERGRFFVDREGVLRLYNRHRELNPPTVSATFDDSAEALHYAYSGELVTGVQARLRGRDLGAVESTLWTLRSTQALRPGVMRLIVRFRDASGQAIGATDVITPVATVDYNATTAPDGGTDATSSVSITVQKLEGGSAKLRIESTHSDVIYLQAGARLRGTPLIPAESMLVEAVDDLSAQAHGADTLTLNLPALDSLADAEQIAQFELSRRGTVQGVVDGLTLSNRTRLTEALTLTLFDVVRVVDARNGHDADYRIIGEAHEVTQGGARHLTTWTLEPVSALAYWVLDVSALGVDTRLGY